MCVSMILTMFLCLKYKAVNLTRSAGVFNMKSHTHTHTHTCPVADPGIQIRRGGGGGHEMSLNVKGTVGSFGGQKLIYNLIITRKI